MEVGQGGHDVRFNPRTRVGCDIYSAIKRSRTRRFQSTHPRGVRLRPFRVTQAKRSVSIHAPAWGATSDEERLGLYDYSFNPRTRVGCDAAQQALEDDVIGFNPRTRVGCDQFVVHGLDLSATFQSTHPRGVRRYQNRYDEYRWHVSIHAPAWGATSLAQCKAAQRRAFQSTHPRGVRPGHLLVRLRGMQVSIHAPAWGATSSGVWQYGQGTAFQSTHPRGVRRGPGTSSSTMTRCFNPRTRVGCDPFDPPSPPLPGVFQSTHPRGVRRGSSSRLQSWSAMFQSTHPRGVRLDMEMACSLPGKFQSTHPRGVRPEDNDAT